MSRRLTLAALAALLVFAAACRKSGPADLATASPPAPAPPSAAVPPSTPAAPASATPDQAAITAAIERHLHDNKNINLAVLDMVVAPVAVHGDQAVANAQFRLKQAGTTMQMTYFLQRHAGDWIVIRSQPGGGQFEHPPMDPNHPPTDPHARHLPTIHDFYPAPPPRQP